MSALTGKTALITGGASGIGRAMARRFAQDGANVVLCDINDDLLEATAAEVRADGGEALAVHTDITVEGDVRAAVNASIARYGKLDILVNNASVVGQVAPVAELGLEEWDASLRINLTGAVLCSREALRAMLLRKSGAILNVSSNVGRRGYPNRAPYVCSKWALLGLTQTLALEVAHLGVRVNAICPGPVLTARLERAIAEIASVRGVPSYVIHEEWKSQSPMGRFVTEEECASVALFLVSDASSSMTGQALNVTAGMIMT